MLKNIHTHCLSACPQTELLSVCYQDAETEAFKRALHLSVGIHPWYLTAADYSLQVEWLDIMVHDSRVLAIGEGGLDKLCGTPMELQEKAFRHQIELSEKFHLPLVIHCVKCAPDLIRLKKEYRPRSPWILHGFRGKPQQAQEYLRHGFYLSYGEKYTEASLRLTPSDRLLLETDESQVPLEELYIRAASLREIPLAELEESVLENINGLFY